MYVCLIIIVKTPRYVYIAFLQVVFILYKLFIWKDSFLWEADYFQSMSRVPLGWGIEHQLKKKSQIPGGVSEGGIVTARIEPCISGK